VRKLGINIPFHIVHFKVFMNTDNKIVGFLDQVTDASIYGWVTSSMNERPLQVRLIIDNKEVASMTSDIFRQDLQKAGVHPSGHCGFFFDLKESNIKLCTNCIIQIIVDYENTNLVNSPWFYYSDQYLNEIRNETEKIKFNEDDINVLIVGLAKSGTSILTYSISSALSESTVYFEPHTTQCLNHIEFHRNLHQDNLVVTKALYYPQYPHQLPLVSAYYNKKICIIRDPRDLLLSTFLE